MAGGFLTWELQKATVAAIEADATVKGLVGDPVRIFDRIPENTPLPYITVGDTSSADDGTKDTEAQDHDVAFEMFSADGGREEVKKIQAAIHDALHLANLTMDAGTLVCIRYMSSSDTKEDILRYSGVITFNAVTQG